MSLPGTNNNQPANQYYSQPISFGLIPKEGPKFIPVNNVALTGTNITPFVIDLTTAQQNYQLSMVQTVFVDNRAGTAPVLIYQLSAQEAISVPAGDQGYYPILVSGNMKFAVSSVGAGTANFGFINVLIQAAQWSGLVTAPVIANPLPVADAIMESTVSGGRVLTTTQDNYTITDHSGTVTAGGAANNIAAANAARQGYLIQNIDELTIEPLYYSLTGAAAPNTPGTFTLAPGGGAGFPGGSAQGKGTGAISVYAATTGHKVSCVTW